jgi:tRNA threonylcarbamoyladenosine biosynthesis protein TsaB
MTDVFNIEMGSFAAAPAFTALGIETATSRSTVAVCYAGKTYSVTLSGSRPGAGEVYGAVDALLQAAGIVPADLQCIAFGCGPGGFTGVRIAAAVTQGLAYGLQIPVFRCSTLALLAASASGARAGSAVIAAALDARQGEAYVGFYRVADGDVQQVRADALCDPASVRLKTIAAAEDISNFYLAGPGWSVYPELLEGAEDLVTGEGLACLPEAVQLFPLAVAAQHAGTLTDAFAAQPNYLRDKVTD